MTEGIVDDRIMRDLIAGGIALPTVLVAHELGLFASLAAAPLTLVELSTTLGLPVRSVSAILAVAAALGLVQLDAERYALCAPARAFLLPDSPTSFAGYLDLLIANAHRNAYAGIRSALLYGRPPDDVETLQDRTLIMTRAMHDRGVVAARAWVQNIDLSAHEMLLDIGGGSGVHAMEAVRRWPRMRACVLDRAQVCAIAAEHIAAAGLADRVATRAADYLDTTPFPQADVHLYSEVLHNRHPDEARELIEKSRAALPAGGRVVIHEMLLDDDRCGPLAVATANVNMLLWTRGGRQVTRAELTALLQSTGFVDIESAATGCGYFSIVSARTPT